MRKILVLLSLGLVALTGCKKDSPSSFDDSEGSLIVNPVIPEESFAPGESVTITGTGFTEADEIWFRAQTKAEGDIQAVVTRQTPTEITFTVPQELAAGEQTILLKRNDQEMILGQITIAETAVEPVPAKKLYSFGATDHAILLWEIDKATGELTEIIQLPIDSTYGERWESPVVNPADGNIYLLKEVEDVDLNETSFYLYRVDPDAKSLEPVDLLVSGALDAIYCLLCIANGKLHTLCLRETHSDDSENTESSLSLIAIDSTTATQTTVADFGSLHQALNLPANASVELPEDPSGLIYDASSNSLIVSVDIEQFNEDADEWEEYFRPVRLDLSSRKITAGDVTSSDLTLFSMGDKICGAFYNDDDSSVDFRPIDVQNLTLGSSIGNITLDNGDLFFPEYAWFYDVATHSGYKIIWKNAEQLALGVYDFDTRELKEIKNYGSDADLWMIFQ